MLHKRGVRLVWQNFCCFLMYKQDHSIYYWNSTKLLNNKSVIQMSSYARLRQDLNNTIICKRVIYTHEINVHDTKLSWIRNSYDFCNVLFINKAILGTGCKWSPLQFLCRIRYPNMTQKYSCLIHFVFKDGNEHLGVARVVSFACLTPISVVHWIAMVILLQLRHYGIFFMWNVHVHRVSYT